MRGFVRLALTRREAGRHRQKRRGRWCRVSAPFFFVDGLKFRRDDPIDATVLFMEMAKAAEDKHNAEARSFAEHKQSRFPDPTHKTWPPSGSGTDLRFLRALWF